MKDIKIIRLKFLDCTFAEAVCSYIQDFSLINFCILSVKSVHLNKYFYLWFSGLLLTTAMSYPPVYYKFSRLSKDFIRFYDGIFLASAFVLCFKIHWELGFLSIFAFIFVKNLYNLKRKGDACTGCPRLSEGTTCEGYILQKEALLKIDEEYSDIMTKQLLKKEGLNFMINREDLLAGTRPEVGKRVLVTEKESFEGYQVMDYKGVVWGISMRAKDAVQDTMMSCKILQVEN